MKRAREEFTIAQIADSKVSSCTSEMEGGKKSNVSSHKSRKRFFPATKEREMYILVTGGVGRAGEGGEERKGRETHAESYKFDKVQNADSIFAQETRVSLSSKGTPSRVLAQSYSAVEGFQLCAIRYVDRGVLA